MRRTLNIRTMKQIKFKTFKFTLHWLKVFGVPEQKGLWIVYAKDKNGKTWFTLKLAEYLSSFLKTLYVSAEEGLRKSFIDNIERARLDDSNNNLQFIDRLSIEDLSEKLNARRAPKIVIIDNLTAYKGEIKISTLNAFLESHKDKLIIIVAHENKNEPDGAVGVHVKKLAQIIMRVQGLKCFVSGRCPGGTLIIDEEKSTLYHGTEIE